MQFVQFLLTQSFMRLFVPVIFAGTVGVVVVTQVTTGNNTNNGTQTPTADVSITATPSTGTPSATVTPVPEGDVIVVIEGPVGAINVNFITIYDIDVKVANDDPILRIIKIGDFVRVRGSYDDQNVLIATVVSNVLTPGSNATVALNGKVEAINGSMVVINGINVQFDPNSPQLTKIKIGDVITIEGNFQRTSTTIILVVVNVVIINNVIVMPGVPAGCKLTAKGARFKCSKKSSKKSS